MDEVVKNAEQSNDSMDVRASSHWTRNGIIVVVLIAAAVGVWRYSQYSSTQDTTRLERFDAFRAAYAEKCNVPAYAGPVAEVVRDDYLTSDPIKLEVDRQTAALKRGVACETVVAKLKAVDLAIPAPGPAR